MGGKILAVFVVVLGVSSAAPAVGTWKKALDSTYAAELRRCKETWVAISKRENPDEVGKCLFSLLMSVGPRLSEPGGVVPVGGPRMDPMLLKDPIQIGNSNLFKGVLENLEVSNVAKGITPQHTSLSYDPTKKQAVITVRYPVDLLYNSRYNFNMNTGALFGQSSGGTTTIGNLKGSVSNVVATFRVNFAHAKNGELRIRSSEGSITAAKNNLNFKSDDPSDTLSNFLNTLLRNQESALQVFGETEPHISRFLAQALGRLFHQGWKVLDQL
jgi:hypothetical protein